MVRHNAVLHNRVAEAGEPMPVAAEQSVIKFAGSNISLSFCD